MIQRHKLSETDYRGERFRNWKGKDLKGSLELLLLTKPEIIEQIHTQYLESGADIIETNTFSGTTIGLHDFLFSGEPPAGRKDQEFFQRVVDDIDLRALVHEMNDGRDNCAAAADPWRKPGSPFCRIDGSSHGASISPDVNVRIRAVSFDQLKQAYFDRQRRSSRRCRSLLVETIFDTLNAKAALIAISEVFRASRKKLRR
jgi:5-methyltetrahydrofolate--homocysteine methyltransferase